MLVPLSTLDALQFALQLVVLVLLSADLLGDLVAIGSIELGDELWNEVLVLQRFLDGRQGGVGLLALAWIRDVSIRVIVIRLLVVDLLPQAFQVEVAQRIGTETAALVGAMRSNVRILLQQV